jgi:hypothetical protein
MEEKTYLSTLIEKLGGADVCAAGYATGIEDHKTWCLIKKNGSTYVFNLEDVKAKLDAKPELVKGDLFTVLATHDHFEPAALTPDDVVLAAKEVRHLEGAERADYVAKAFALTPTDREIISSVSKHIANNYVFRYLKFVRAKAQSPKQ